MRRSSDFDRVFSTGRRRRHGAVTVVVAPGEPGLIRVGLVAGRKIGNAVKRNRAKRRLRHAVREVGPAPGRDYVVIASAGVLTASFQDLVGWLERGMKE